METQARLTRLAKCAGCGAKVGAGTLAQLLDGFQSHRDERLVVGFDKSDDACVYLLDENRVLIETVDFFPPIVDDPYLFGQIAAANALSDIYAMGGEPALALNVMSVTEDMTEKEIREILRGGYDKVYEAGAVIAGGHTITTAEPVYGLQVTGFAHPQRFWKNAGAREGDVLLLTKPLGAGILTTARKGGEVDDAVYDALCAQMCTLNRKAAEILRGFEVHACTDVTGFGLMGHAYEMAGGSGVTVRIFTEQVPYIREAYACAEYGFVPAGAYRNREYTAGRVFAEEGITRAMEDILYDPQTSGGLLAAIPAAQEKAALDALRAADTDAACVGEICSDDRDSLDFDERVLRKRGDLEGGARGEGLTEKGGIHLVHRRKVRDIF